MHFFTLSSQLPLQIIGVFLVHIVVHHHYHESLTIHLNGYPISFGAI